MAPSWLKKLRSRKQAGKTSKSQPADTYSASLVAQDPEAASSHDQSEISSRPLQERLWNQAYEQAKASDPDVVEAYEKTISRRELHASQRTSPDAASHVNQIDSARETRWQQMETIVRAGLERTEKEAAMKERVGNTLETIGTIKTLVGNAVQAAPEAAVAWSGVCLALEILSNPINEANVNREGIAYVISRMNWYWHLADLLLKNNNNRDDSSAKLRTRLEKQIVDLYQQLLLYQMKSVCLYYRHRGLVFLRDLVKLDDWDGQLSHIRDAEVAIQEDSRTFSTLEVRKHLESLASSGGSLQRELQDIRSVVQDNAVRQERARVDEKMEQCLRDLRVTDPCDDKIRIEQTKGGLLRDSYQWILQHEDYLHWQTDSNRRLLWVKGDPGKGKTMLLCCIIDEMQKQKTTSKATQPCYFFCQATDSRLNNATGVLRGLIYSLVKKNQDFISHVLEKYNSAGHDLFQDVNSWVALSQIFGKILEDPSSGDQVFIVDALDECMNDLPQLLDLIVEASAKYRSKWVVSSRNWSFIEDRLQTGSQKVWLSLELNERSISDAVGAYIDRQVDKLSRLKKLDPATLTAVQEKLVQNANGTFLWVALVCKELSKEGVRRRHMLETVSAFPPDLDPLFRRMMEQIRASRDADICQQILGLVSVVYRPISLTELKSFLAIDESGGSDDLEDLEEIIASCGSFLVIRNEVVYFVHQSAKDFLKASDQILTTGSGNQHHGVFLKSLDVLSETLRRDIYNLRKPGASTKKVCTPNPDPLAHARYSCIFWVDHLKDADLSETERCESILQDEGVVHMFLRDNLLYWLEALSLISKISEGVIAIRTLEALITQKTSRTGKFVRDAHRFILSHRFAIELAPLQVYTSALIFSPASSVVRQTFEETQGPKWIVTKPRMQPEWSACLQTLECHGNGDFSVAFSPGGAWLASKSGQFTIWIWDLATGACLQTLEDEDIVRLVAFAPDSKRLASGSSTVKIWDIATGACIQKIDCHQGPVRSVAFSANGLQLASGSEDGTIKIWDPTAGTCLQTLEGHGQSVRSVAFSLDGRLLISGSADKSVKIWDLTTYTCLQTLKDHDNRVTSAAISPDGSQLASASWDKTIKIWNPTAGICRKTIECNNPVWSVSFSPDGSRLASGTGSNCAQVWEPATGKCLQTLEGHSGGVASVAFSLDGTRLVSGSFDDTIKVWDLSIGACPQAFEGHDSQVSSVAFSPDGMQLASGSSDHTIKIWDISTGKCLRTLEGHAGWISSLSFSPNKMHLVSGSGTDTAKIWDPATGACLQTLQGRGTVTSAVFLADGTQLALGSGDNAVRIWDSATGRHLHTLEGHTETVTSLSLSPDSARLASGSYDKTARIWNPATGECLQTLENYQRVTAVAFSPDGIQLAVGGFESDITIWVFDSDITIWDLDSGTRKHVLRGKTGRFPRIVSLAFSPDGTQLGSESRDGTIWIWDVSSGRCLKMKTLEGAIGQVSWDPVEPSRIRTDGSISDTHHPVTDRSPEEDVSHGPTIFGFSISSDKAWVLRQQEPVLWLPPEYRPCNNALCGGTETNITIGCASGRMLFFHFSVAELEAEISRGVGGAR